MARYFEIFLIVIELCEANPLVKIILNFHILPYDSFRVISRLLG